MKNLLEKHVFLLSCHGSGQVILEATFEKCNIKLVIYVGASVSIGVGVIV